MNQPISSLERQQQILQFLQNKSRLSIAELCNIFSVSEATARRDLESLARAGRLQRVHGGAIGLIQPPPEDPILQRQDEQSLEKLRIGQLAASLIQEGETIFLGSGSTVLELARAIRGRMNLTIITNSMPVINVLAGEKGITFICLGGMLRRSELSFIGHITEQALLEVRADQVFIGIRAINLEHGLTNEYLPETQTDRAILKAGQRLVVLADHTKFGRAATVLLSPLASIHTLVTDDETDPGFLAELKSQGIQVLVA